MPLAVSLFCRSVSEEEFRPSLIHRQPRVSGHVHGAKRPKRERNLNSLNETLKYFVIPRYRPTRTLSDDSRCLAGEFATLSKPGPTALDCQVHTWSSGGAQNERKPSAGRMGHFSTEVRSESAQLKETGYAETRGSPDKLRTNEKQRRKLNYRRSEDGPLMVIYETFPTSLCVRSSERSCYPMRFSVTLCI